MTGDGSLPDSAGPAAAERVSVAGPADPDQSAPPGRDWLWLAGWLAACGAVLLAAAWAARRTARPCVDCQDQTEPELGPDASGAILETTALE